MTRAAFDVGGDAVAFMPRARGKIPRIAVHPVQPIRLTDIDWQKLEAALGHVVPEEARTSITSATNDFLQFAEPESNAGSMVDAHERLNRPRSKAEAFRTAIEERSLDDPTRGYVDDWLEMSYERLNPGEPVDHYIVKLSADLARFLEACDLSLRVLEHDAQHNYWPEGGAWEDWTRKLASILEEHHLPTEVRKDAAGYRAERASPFVKFVKALQTFLPARYARGRQSIGALAVAINKAIKRPKPAVAKRKVRAR